MTTWRRRALAIIGLTLIPLAILVPTANADICTTAPAPVSPKAGLPGLFTTPPATIPTAAPDPFATKGVTIGEVYGYNWRWANYDLGCGDDFLRDPTAVVNTQTANTILSAVDATTAGLDSLQNMASTTPLDWLSSTLNGLAIGLQQPVVTDWLPVAIVALGAAVAWAAKRQGYHETARTLAILLGAIALAVFALYFPARFSQLLDKAATTTASVTGAVFNTSAVDTVNRESNYRTWLTGNFGDPDSPTAKKYGPQLLSATNYTWSDWKRINDDPGARKDIDAAKATQFEAVAKGIEADDPAAYEVFTGRGERTGPALFGIVSVGAMGIYIAMAALIVLVARVMMQIITLLAIFTALVAVLPKYKDQTNHIARLWDLFTANLLAIAKFTLAGAIMAVLLTAVGAAPISPGARLFFVVAFTVVGIIYTKPIRSFKTLVPGLDPNTSYVKKLLSYIGPALAAGAGAGAGAAAVITATDDDTRYSVHQMPDEATYPTQQPVAPSLPALPAPTYYVTEAPTAAAAIAPEPAHQQLPSSTAGSTPAAQLEAAPITARAITAGPTANTAPTDADYPATTTAQPDATNTSDVRTVPEATGTVLPSTPPDTQPGPAAPTNPPTTIEPPTVTTTPSWPTLEPTGPAADPTTPVVEPTGIITQTDPGLYRTGQATDTEYLSPTTATEIADDGTEHERVVYQAAERD